jgi:uncharacterized membrane protein (GlpM family)
MNSHAVVENFQATTVMSLWSLEIYVSHFPHLRYLAGNMSKLGVRGGLPY